MRVLFVHPSPLMYSEIYLRLEPLGLELVAASARRAGHDVRLLDLQIFDHAAYFNLIQEWKPEAVGFSLNYLANIPEVVDLAKETKLKLPNCFVFAGGHSASFTAKEILRHADGALACIVRGEGEGIIPSVLDAANDSRGLKQLPGVVTPDGEGPSPLLMDSLDDLRPARDLTSRRKKYFIGVLDPCASIEFTRGCPWDCVFCSAWTFYGRNYRKLSAEVAAADMASIREPGVFIVDDVAFIQSDHGMGLAEEIERRGIKKQYYLETRGDVLIRNKEVFKRWRKLGLEYMFLGLEAIDDAGLKAHRKRITIDKNLEALDVARSLGIVVAVNIIADPSWDADRFEVVRQWALKVPEIVHLTVNTPYPGTETWHTESRNFTTRDYRLFDVQHAVLPTALPLEKFYGELVKTQQVLNKKHLGWAALKSTFGIAARHLSHGQTNFVKMLWKFSSVYNPERQVRDHHQVVKYEMSLPEHPGEKIINPSMLYVHNPEAAHTRHSEARATT
ncbi:MAG TPA: hopanoid C-3 methylase HpnR [Candidatus Acidoferrum sp.]|nr:hopanoid C-3 methylase HpnR [Candidatus Acidoferrum sp.]